MRISDWSSDVCSSELAWRPAAPRTDETDEHHRPEPAAADAQFDPRSEPGAAARRGPRRDRRGRRRRSEEHTSELQSLMRISYAVFCLKKKKKQHQYTTHVITSTDDNTRDYILQ